MHKAATLLLNKNVKGINYRIISFSMKGIHYISNYLSQLGFFVVFFIMSVFMQCKPDQHRTIKTSSPDTRHTFVVDPITLLKLKFEPILQDLVQKSNGGCV